MHDPCDRLAEKSHKLTTIYLVLTRGVDPSRRPKVREVTDVRVTPKAIVKMSDWVVLLLLL